MPRQRKNFWSHTDTAIARAQALDTEPGSRWPTTLGTRVYLILQKIRQVFAL